MKIPSSGPPILRGCLLVLSAAQIAALLVAFERPAQAYVDPGSGYMILQVAGSMFAGAVYYLRHRLKRILGLPRRRAQLGSTVSGTASGAAEVAENQP